MPSIGMMLVSRRVGVCVGVSERVRVGKRAPLLHIEYAISRHELRLHIVVPVKHTS